jgi:hypothetical protein
METRTLATAAGGVHEKNQRRRGELGTISKLLTMASADDTDGRPMRAIAFVSSV